MKSSFYETLYQVCEKTNYLETLQEQGYLVKKGGFLQFTDKALELCEIIAKESPKKKLKEQKDQQDLKEGKEKTNALEIIAKLQTKFKKENLGIPGKCSTFNDVFPKYARFKEEHSYDDETILGATDMYISHMKKTGSIRFVRELHFFFYKRLDGTKDSEVSDLAKWCEEYQDNKSNPDYQAYEDI